MRARTCLIIAASLWFGCNARVQQPRESVDEDNPSTGMMQDDSSRGSSSDLAERNIAEDTRHGQSFPSPGRPPIDAPDPEQLGDGYRVVPCASERGEPAAPVSALDLLLVIDNAETMKTAQNRLRGALPGLLAELTSGDDAFSDVHVGVISSDMGALGVDATGCDDRGADGQLQHTAAASASECTGELPKYASWQGGDDAAELGAQASCLAAVESSSCWLRQPFEAALKGLWPSLDRDPTTGEPFMANRVRFVGDVDGGGMTGHGDLGNAGFLHDDPLSVLAVLVISDRDDCSTANTELAADDSGGAANPEARCSALANDLYAAQRYVNGLRALRHGREHLVQLAALTGVPAGTDSSALDWDDDLARERFFERLTLPAGTAVSCDAGEISARAPQRIVDVVRGLGENGSVSSICDADYAPALARFAAALKRAGQRGDGC